MTGTFPFNYETGKLSVFWVIKQTTVFDYVLGEFTFGFVDGDKDLGIEFELFSLGSVVNEVQVTDVASVSMVTYMCCCTGVRLIGNGRDPL